MERVLEKVTAFITRARPGGDELLLFEHPFAGMQIPAGTVQAGETPREAVLREAAEETGLTEFFRVQALGCDEGQLAPDQRFVVEESTVYARPDVTSFDWARLPPGTLVRVERRAAGFSHMLFEEWDRLPDPQYVTYCIGGWVHDEALTDRRRRHFFHLAYRGEQDGRWTVHTDNHEFTLFWAPLAALPPLIPPQDGWLAFLAPLYGDL